MEFSVLKEITAEDQQQGSPRAFRLINEGLKYHSRMGEGNPLGKQPCSPHLTVYGGVIEQILPSLFTATIASELTMNKVVHALPPSK